MRTKGNRRLQHKMTEDTNKPLAIFVELCQTRNILHKKLSQKPYLPRKDFDLSVDNELGNLKWKKPTEFPI